MRRSTAAAVGTLTGAALVLGVRLTASPPVATSATADPEPSPSSPAKPASKKPGTAGKAAADQSGLKDGRYRGKAADYAYGTVRVLLTIDGGKIVAADATYPVTGYSGTVNPDAIKQLKHETLKEQSAKVDAVSGATLTSAAYKDSLQAALDSAGA
jgi:uncharacterized protein with FMN-binding domain